MKSKQQILSVLVACAVLCAALMFAVFDSDWAVGYVFRR